VVLAWGGVAHQSGSGWVQAVGAVVAGALLVGYLVPAAVAVKVRVTCVSCPQDAEAGVPISFEIVSTRQVRCTAVDPVGPPVLVAPREPTTVLAVAERRGVLDVAVLRVATAVPFGLLWWSRDVRVPLPREIHVSPRLGEALPDHREGSASVTGGARSARSVMGELRSVRSYEHGDSPRSVHWPATAHAGALMVRENEEEVGATVVVRSDLPADPDDAERRAERVLGTVVELLRNGVPVVLETVEPVTQEAATAQMGTRQIATRAVSSDRQPPPAVKHRRVGRRGLQSRSLQPRGVEPRSVEPRSVGHRTVSSPVADRMAAGRRLARAVGPE
jgi:uncharacterized protein (DUF58 family)